MYSLGLNPTQVWTSSETPSHAVGTLVADRDGKIYRMVKADAGGITGAGYVCLIKPSGSAAMINTTNSAPGSGVGMAVGVAMAAVAASGYGWLCVYGQGVPTQVNALCAAGTRLNTTATAGQLDDDGTAGAEQVIGISLEAARGGTAGTANASLNFPSVSVTL
jgi:hypothetical protein